MKAGLYTSLELSLLDKLCVNSGTTGERIKSGLARDIEDLLNTQISAKKWPESFEALDGSLLNFGVIDFTTARVFQKYNTTDILGYLTAVIERWEPRLTSVNLDIVSANNEESSTLQVRITALAFADGSLQEITLDTTLDLDSGEVQAKG